MVMLLFAASQHQGCHAAHMMQCLRQAQAKQMEVWFLQVAWM
jgi:hypothetical protein